MNIYFLLLLFFEKHKNLKRFKPTTTRMRFKIISSIFAKTFSGFFYARFEKVGKEK
jgi:hypothetical protein